jgi:hypothetical protein
VSLTTLLADDLLLWLDATPDESARHVLLWLDPESQFRRLVGGLAVELAPAEVRLAVCDPAAGVGQLALKLALLKAEAEAGVRTVVYLPGFGRADLEPRPDGTPPRLWSVYEYRYKGCVWRQGERWEAGQVPEPLLLVSWLQRHGLHVAPGAERALTGGGADSLLARFAERQTGSDPGDWPKPLRVDDVRDALAGDPRDELRSILTTPNNTLKRWGDERSLVLARIDEEFGLDLGTISAEGDAEQLADAAAVGVALAEAWIAFERPKDFPFASRLPSKVEQRERLARFLREEVLPHAELRPRFRARLARLEPGYDLRAWAAGREGQPAGFPLLARARWDAFLARLAAAERDGWQAARDLVVAERTSIDVAAGGSWSFGSGRPSDEALPWSVASAVAALTADGQRATDEVGSPMSGADLVGAYVERWWKIDDRQRQIRAACAARRGLETIGRLADAAYCAWVFRASDRLAEIFEADPTWPPAQTAGVASITEVLWSAPRGNSRRGIIVADAVRWDLGEAIRARLGDSTTLTPVVATLPTETPFGMSALLPLGPILPEVDFESGSPRLCIGDGPNLATREGRKVFLRSALVGPAGKSGVDFIDLADLLRARTVPSAPIVVVFDNAIDEQGHSNAEILSSQLPNFVDNLARAVELLHEAGLAEVHLVTDHGFLLLPPEAVNALGHPPVLPAHALRKDVRWAALKPDSPARDVLRVPLPLAPNAVELALPRGARTFIAAQPYLHGGLSLQECVIPHLVSRRTFARAKVGVDLEVKNPYLTGGTVTVVLRPQLPAGQGTLGGVEATWVRLSIETDPTDGSTPRLVLPPFDVELRPDVDELRPPVYLPEGVDLKADQKLRLRAVDRDTGRELGSLSLTLTVDWD